MSEPRRHHLVPAFYLRGFANQAGRVAVVSRDGANRYVASVERAATETDFYAVNTADGRSQEVERILSRVEDAAAPALAQMLAGVFPPSAPGREDVSWFIAFQLLRGRHFRYVVNALADAFAPDREAHHVQARQNRFVEQMVRSARDIIGSIGGRSWYLIRYARPLLLTSDVPVAKWSRRRPPAPFWGVGLGTAELLSFPVDCQHALLMLAPDLASREVVQRQDERHAKAINLLTAAGAFDWIFHHPEHDPLEDLELPAPEPPVEIG